MLYKKCFIYLCIKSVWNDFSHTHRVFFFIKMESAFSNLNIIGSSVELQYILNSFVIELLSK